MDEGRPILAGIGEQQTSFYKVSAWLLESEKDNNDKKFPHQIPRDWILGDGQENPRYSPPRPLTSNNRRNKRVKASAKRFKRDLNDQLEKSRQSGSVTSQSPKNENNASEDSTSINCACDSSSLDDSPPSSAISSAGVPLQALPSRKRQKQRFSHRDRQPSAAVKPTIAQADESSDTDDTEQIKQLLEKFREETEKKVQQVKTEIDKSATVMAQVFKAELDNLSKQMWETIPKVMELAVEFFRNHRAHCRAQGRLQ